MWTKVRSSLTLENVVGPWFLLGLVVDEIFLLGIILNWQPGFDIWGWIIVGVLLTIVNIPLILFEGVLLIFFGSMGLAILALKIEELFPRITIFRGFYEVFD